MQGKKQCTSVKELFFLFLFLFFSGIKTLPSSGVCVWGGGGGGKTFFRACFTGCFDDRFSFSEKKVFVLFQTFPFKFTYIPQDRPCMVQLNIFIKINVSPAHETSDYGFQWKEMVMTFGEISKTTWEVRILKC